MSVRDHYSEDQIVVHQVSKEDKDLILEYNLVEEREIPREDIFNVKVDNVISRNELVAKILRMTERKGVHLVYGVDPYKIMDLRKKLTLRRMVNRSDLVFAAGGGLPWAAKMIHRPIEDWINPISMIVDLLRLSEVKDLPIFFLGGRPSVTEGSYFNLKKSFPEMKVVGRHTGYFDNNREKAVLQAIRKTSPKVLLVGLGYPKELEWIRRNQKQLENMVVIGVGGSFDIMSGKAKKAPDFFQNRGLTWLYRIITRPYRLLAWWRMFLFYLFTLFFHLFKKPNKKQAQKK